MDQIKCKHCKKPISSKMGEVEYSQFINEFFCNPDHAHQYYLDYMQSRPVELNKDDLNLLNVELQNGFLFGKTSE